MEPKVFDRMLALNLRSGYALSRAAARAMLKQGRGATEANRKAMPKADVAKWTKPKEIARVILFLCSDDAKVIHAAALPVYGAA